MRQHKLAFGNLPLGVTLRKSNSDDLEFLFALHKAAMKPSLVAAIGKYHDQTQQDMLEEVLDSDDLWIIERMGQSIGCVNVSVAGDVFVSCFALLPDYQSLGIGGHILRKIYGHADSIGGSTGLEVYKDSRAAGFYAKHGFLPLPASRKDTTQFFRRPLRGKAK